MMSTAKHIGRVGALAVALGIGTARRHATRVTMSIGVAALVVTAAAAPMSTESPAVTLSADSTALLLCGTACPTWNDAHVEDIKNQFIAPTHPGQDIDYVAVTAPMEAWPLNGLFRVLGLLGFGEPGCARPGGDCWPDYPLWKLSGLFDLTYDQSVQTGVGALEQAMAAAGNDHLVIYGDSQGANVANMMKRKLAEQYPDAEDRHDTVAGVLHRPAVAAQHGRQALQQVGHDLAQPLGIQSSRDRHRVHHIGEQHGHLFVLGRLGRQGDPRATFMTELLFSRNSVPQSAQNTAAAVMSSPRPRRCALRSQAIPPSRDSDSPNPGRRRPRRGCELATRAAAAA